MTLRPSVTTIGREANESSVSTRSATDRVAALPEPMAMPEIGVLEGQDVVDAVAGHGDHVTLALQGVDHGLLLAGGDPAEHVVVGHGQGDGVVVGRAFGHPPGDHGRRVRPVRAIALTVSGLSPEMILIVTP